MKVILALANQIYIYLHSASSVASTYSADSTSDREYESASSSRNASQDTHIIAHDEVPHELAVQVVETLAVGDTKDSSNLKTSNDASSDPHPPTDPPSSPENHLNHALPIPEPLHSQPEPDNRPSESDPTTVPILPSHHTTVDTTSRPATPLTVPTTAITATALPASPADPIAYVDLKIVRLHYKRTLGDEWLEKLLTIFTGLTGNKGRNSDSLSVMNSDNIMTAELYTEADNKDQEVIV